MQNVFAIWDRLGPRQKVAAGAIGSAFLAWAVGKFLDYFSAHAPD